MILIFLASNVFEWKNMKTQNVPFPEKMLFMARAEIRYFL